MSRHNVEQIALEENFLSSTGIAETARRFIEQNNTRLAKAMRPTGAQSYEAGDIVALALGNPDAEAKYIGDSA